MTKQPLLALPAAIITLTILSGCESSTAIMSSSQKGIGALSCPEINKVFTAFENDRQSVGAAKELGEAFGIPYTPGTNLGNYYELAKSTANIALLAQGCPPLSQ